MALTVIRKGITMSGIKRAAVFGTVMILIAGVFVGCKKSEPGRESQRRPPRQEANPAERRDSPQPPRPRQREHVQASGKDDDARQEQPPGGLGPPAGPAAGCPAHRQQRRDDQPLDAFLPALLGDHSHQPAGDGYDSHIHGIGDIEDG